MPTRRPAETTPDLFSALPTVTAAGPSAVPKGKAGPDSPASQQRHFLPEDLAGALKRLDDVEIDALLAAVTTEAERRGRRPPSPAKEKPVADAKPQRRQEAAEDGAGSLTTGKLNAVRAAFKAGVKPSAIARQFGISQSDVRKALAQGPRRGLNREGPPSRLTLVVTRGEIAVQLQLSAGHRARGLGRDSAPPGKYGCTAAN